MDLFLESFSRAIEELLGRASGPMHFRLVMQPIVASLLAIRAGLKDGREGQPAFFWTFLTHPAERQRLAQSGWKDISKVFVLALVLDSAYQLVVLREFHVLQTLIVAFAVALLPYLLIRGPVSRLVRRRER